VKGIDLPRVLHYEGIMGRSGRALGLVALGLLALGAPAGAGAAEPVRCASIKTVRVSDLGMTPSPLPQGEAVQRWVAKLEVAGSGECAVRLRVREGARPASVELVWTLRPGLNVIPIPGAPGFRVAAGTPCFHVAADLRGGARPLDGPRFCAKRQSGSPPAFTLE